MAFLDMIKSAAKVCIDSTPSAAIASTDPAIVSMVRFANEEGEDLAQRFRWQRLVREATFTSTAATSQGSILTKAGSSFSWICNDTMWNRTQARKMFPIDDIQWQQMKANNFTGPYEYFRLRGNLLLVMPTMTAGETVAFEWISKQFCQSSGGTAQSAWAADTDTGILDEGVMTLGIIWRFKKDQGRPDWKGDYDLYERRVQNAARRDGANPRIILGGGSKMRFISNNNVREGSWV